MFKQAIIVLQAGFICLFVVQPALALQPDDYFYYRQWYLDQINIEPAWDTTTGTNEVIVAVLDTGVDLDHPDLAGNLWTNQLEVAGDGLDNDGNGFIDDVAGWDFVEDDNSPEPEADSGYSVAALQHGTLIAGVIGAVGDNAEGVAGINWDVQLMPVRILDEVGSGNSGDAAAAIDYAVANGAQVINLSFSGFTPDAHLRNAIGEAYRAGVTVVAAVGNNENGGDDVDEVPIYPACYNEEGARDWVLGVAATDDDDNKASFSNYGSCVDISAPGVGIFGTLYQEDFHPDASEYYGGSWDGTSVAAPQVAGAAALLYAMYPDISAQEVMTVLKLSAVPVAIGTEYFGQLGAGRLDVARAIEIVSDFAGTTTVVVDPSYNFVVGKASGDTPQVSTFDILGSVQETWFAYDEAFEGGVRVALGDVDGDGVEEIVAGAGPGGGPHVRVFETDGTLLGQFFAYDEASRTGVFVATGDINGDGYDEIIVSEDAGSNGEVRFYDYAGVNKGHFKPFDNESRGVRVAAGDVDGDGVDEVITGLGPGGAPRVRVFEGSGMFVSEFDAYASTFDKGIFVTAGDVDGDGYDEIVTGVDYGGGPHVRVFSASGEVESSFFAYGENFRGGVRLAVGDVNADGTVEIVTAPGPGGGPHVRVFQNNEVIAQFFAYAESLRTGINIAAWNL